MRIKPARVCIVRCCMMCVIVASFFAPVFADVYLSADVNEPDFLLFRQSIYDIQNDFRTNTTRILLQYEFRNTLEKEDSQKLQSMIRQAKENLASRLQQVESVKQQIEAYAGDDWEQKYGRTKRWRNVTSLSFDAQIMLLELKFYETKLLTFEDRLSQVELLVLELEDLKRASDFSRPLQLQAEMETVLAQNGLASKKNTLILLDEFKECSDVRKPITAMLLRSKILGCKAGGLKWCVQSFSGHVHRYNLDLAGALALQLRKCNRYLYEEFIATDPLLRLLMGELLANEMTYALQKGKADSFYYSGGLNVVDIDAIAEFLSSCDEEKYAPLLKFMLDKKLKTAGLTYIAAIKAQSQPLQAAKYFLTASNLQDERYTFFIGKTANELAEVALDIAGSAYPDRVTADEILQFNKQYEKLAPHPRERSLELSRARLLARAKWYEQAYALYESLTKKNDDVGKNAKLDLFRWRYTNGELGGLCEKAKELSDINDFVGDVNNDYLIVVLEVMNQVIEKWEEFVERCENSQKYAPSISTLAASCNAKHNLPATNQLDIEVQIVADANGDFLDAQQRRLQRYLRERPDLENAFMQCSARLAMKQRQYEQAAQLWAQLANALRFAKTPKANYAYWRARYYELLCCQQGALIEKGKIVHAAEILLADANAQTPEFWSQKLGEIVEEIQSSKSN